MRRVWWLLPLLAAWAAWGGGALAQGVTAEGACAVHLADGGAPAACSFTLTNAGPAPAEVTLEFGHEGAADRPAPGAVLGVSARGDAGIDLAIADGVIHSTTGHYVLRYSADLVWLGWRYTQRMQFLAFVLGIAFDEDGSRAWQLETYERRDCGPCIELEYARIMETTLDGALTGHYLDVPFGPAWWIYGSGLVGRLVLDGETFYYTDNVHKTLYAVEKGTGQALPGYPVPISDYHAGPRSLALGGLSHTRRPDAAGGGAYVELAIGVNAVHSAPQRVVAMDPETGANLGPETPLPYHLRGVNPDGQVGHVKGVLRSPVAPDSVLYFMSCYQCVGGGIDRLYAVRPAYVPPYGVSLSEGHFPFGLIALAPGESREVTATFERRGALPGVYAAEVVVRASGWAWTPGGLEPEGGLALAAVPVEVSVGGVSAGGGPFGGAWASLGVHPNPARGRAQVTLGLPASGDVTLAVYDVLGRRVGVVHEGPLASGEHALSVDVWGLAPGAYVVRASGAGFAVSRRVTAKR